MRGENDDSAGILTKWEFDRDPIEMRTKERDRAKRASTIPLGLVSLYDPPGGH